MERKESENLHSNNLFLAKIYIFTVRHTRLHKTCFSFLHTTHNVSRFNNHSNFNLIRGVAERSYTIVVTSFETLFVSAASNTIFIHKIQVDYSTVLIRFDKSPRFSQQLTNAISSLDIHEILFSILQNNFNFSNSGEKKKFPFQV